MDSVPKIRRLSDLREGRWGQSGTRYFITFCTNGRARVLIGMPAQAIAAEVGKMMGESVVSNSALMVMPDHVHWLFKIGSRLKLGQVVARLKSKTGPVLAGHGAKWQPNYFEHRLRPDEDSERYALYMFLNPYRAKLIGMDQRWSHWFRPETGRWVFEDFLTEEGCPPAHWLESIENPMRKD